jgi:hypothetical protein
MYIFLTIIASGFLLAVGAMSIALIATALTEKNTSPGRPYDWEVDGL